MDCLKGFEINLPVKLNTIVENYTVVSKKIRIDLITLLQISIRNLPQSYLFFALRLKRIGP